MFDFPKKKIDNARAYRLIYSIVAQREKKNLCLGKKKVSSVNHIKYTWFANSKKRRTKKKEKINFYVNNTKAYKCDDSSFSEFSLLLFFMCARSLSALCLPIGVSIVCEMSIWLNNHNCESVFIR